jgi:hypothetical protein
MWSSSLGLLAGMILLVGSSIAQAEEPVLPAAVPTETQAGANPEVGAPAAVPSVPASVPMVPRVAEPSVAPGAQLRAPGAPAAGVPLARRWWFWAGLGAAAAAVVVVALVITPREAYSGNASPGVVTVF